MQQPSVSRIVHYVSYGTPPKPDGSQAFAGACRAAVITEAGGAAGDHPAVAQNPAAQIAGLCVLNPTGLFFSQGVPEDQGADAGAADSPFCGGRIYHGGTWHWPERV